ncbi:transcriptional regulator [Salmonella enterica]|uniref:transcriptional regulator n=1 Tax=Salmonella enterica TaxID=28901 RepID=UPI003D31F22C
MDLKNYITKAARGEAKSLATQLGVSRSYLSQMASGVAVINPERCVKIELATKGVVSRKDLRPDDWMRIWPELADSEQIPSTQKQA